MFGKNSVSTLLFWTTCAIFIFCFCLYFDTIFSISGYIISTNLATTILTATPILILLYLLILIFKCFKSNKMFTSKIINYLNIFAIVNLFMPLIPVIFYLIIYEKVLWKKSIEAFPFIIIAIFSFFLAAIFKQGFQIQQENDLTI